MHYSLTSLCIVLHTVSGGHTPALEWSQFCTEGSMVLDFLLVRVDLVVTNCSFSHFNPSSGRSEIYCLRD